MTAGLLDGWLVEKSVGLMAVRLVELKAVPMANRKVERMAAQMVASWADATVDATVENSVACLVVQSERVSAAVMFEKMAAVMEAVLVGKRVGPWVVHSAAMLAESMAVWRVGCWVVQLGNVSAAKLAAEKAAPTAE